MGRPSSRATIGVRLCARRVRRRWRVFFAGGAGKVDAGGLGERWPKLVAHNAGRRLLQAAGHERGQLERPEREADQTVDLEPQMFEHALDLTVLALTKTDGEPDVRALRAIEFRL